MVLFKLTLVQMGSKKLTTEDDVFGCIYYEHNIKHQNGKYSDLLAIGWLHKHTFAVVDEYVKYFYEQLYFPFDLHICSTTGR